MPDESVGIIRPSPLMGRRRILYCSMVRCLQINWDIGKADDMYMRSVGSASIY